MAQAPQNGITLLDISSLPDSIALRAYLQWWKFMGEKRTIRFSHAHWNTSLHASLTLAENLALESENQGDDHRDIEAHITGLGLLPLLHQLKGLKSWSAQMGQQEKVIASLLKALISPLDKVLIELPAQNLEPFTMGLVKRILQEQASKKHITLVVTHPGFWLDCAHRLVTFHGEHFTMQELAAAATQAA